MEFIKNELLAEVFNNSFELWATLVDKGDFVPPQYIEKMDKYIFDNMKAKVGETGISYKYAMSLLPIKKRPWWAYIPILNFFFPRFRTRVIYYFTKLYLEKKKQEREEEEALLKKAIEQAKSQKARV